MGESVEREAKEAIVLLVGLLPKICRRIFGLQHD